MLLLTQGCGWAVVLSVRTELVLRNSCLPHEKKGSYLTHELSAYKAITHIPVACNYNIRMPWSVVENL